MYTVFQLSKKDHKACVGNHKFQCLEHAIDLFEAFTLENTPAELVGEGRILYVNYPNKSENNSDDGLTRVSGFEIVQPQDDTKETKEVSGMELVILGLCIIAGMTIAKALGVM